MIKQISSRSTKAQILEAFNQLFEEHQQMKAKYSQLLKKTEGLEKQLSELGAAPTAVEERPIAEEAKGYTLDTILDGLTTLRAGFGNVISELSARLTTEAAKLEELRHDVEAKANQLTALHSLTITEDKLDNLIQEYEEKSRAFQEEAKQKRQAFEKERAEKREAWQKEKEEQSRAVKERNESLKRERQRSHAEYKYDLDMARKLDAEQYAQKRKELYRQLEEMVEAKEKEWQEREQAIARQEKEYKELEARVKASPRELEAAIKKAEKEGAEIARKQAKVKDDLLAKEEEGHRRVSELKIQSLEETIERQTRQIDALSTQLNAVVRQDQDLAVKAIEGASHETSFRSVREIALEQAKNLPKSK